MRNAYILLGIFVLTVLLYPSSVNCYTLLSGNWNYQTNPMGEPMVVDDNTPDTAGELDAILAAMSTWDNAGAKFKFTYGGRAGNPAPTYDGVNQIRWEPRYDATWLAVCTWWSSSGRILEADIIFNERYDWASGDTIPIGTYDVQSVALHELGHVLGLGHSAPPAIMQTVIGSGLKRRVLTSDDINGLLAIYGSSTSVDNPPVANAGQDQTKASGELVQLDSSQSYDPDNDPLAYQWTQTAGQAVALSNSTTANPTFTAPSVTVQTYLIFELKVTANTLSSTDTVQITVQPPPDTTAPSVSMSSPANGVFVRSIITVSATATDNIGVAKVEFSKDSDATPFYTTTASPYAVSWNTATVSDGAHTLKAIAYDEAGNQSTASVSVIVDNTAPTVSVISPANGAAVSGTVVVSVDASDVTSGIQRVEFYRDADILLGQSTISPYGISWDTKTVANGSHSLYVKAYDEAGNIAQSVSVNVSVNNAALTQTPWKTNAYGTLTTNISWNYAMGYHFTPLKDGTITKVGGFFNGTKVVKLFNKSTKTLIASATVTASNSWGYASITPISVKAGTTYTVAVYLNGSGGSRRSSLSPALPRIFGDIRIEGSTYASTSYNSSKRPTNSIYSTMYGQADVEFAPGG